MRRPAGMSERDERPFAVPFPAVQQFFLHFNEARLRERQTIVIRLQRTEQKLAEEQQWSRQLAQRCTALEGQVNGLEKETASHVSNITLLRSQVAALERRCARQGRQAGTMQSFQRTGENGNPTANNSLAQGALDVRYGDQHAYPISRSLEQSTPTYTAGENRPVSCHEQPTARTTNIPIYTPEQKRYIRERLLKGRGPSHGNGSNIVPSGTVGHAGPRSVSGETVSPQDEDNQWVPVRTVPAPITRWNPQAQHVEPSTDGQRDQSHSTSSNPSEMVGSDLTNNLGPNTGSTPYTARTGFRGHPTSAATMMSNMEPATAFATGAATESGVIVHSCSSASRPKGQEEAMRVGRPDHHSARVDVHTNPVDRTQRGGTLGGVEQWTTVLPSRAENSTLTTTRAISVTHAGAGMLTSTLPAHATPEEESPPTVNPSAASVRVSKWKPMYLDSVETGFTLAPSSAQEKVVQTTTKQDGSDKHAEIQGNYPRAGLPRFTHQLLTKIPHVERESRTIAGTFSLFSQSLFNVKRFISFKALFCILSETPYPILFSI